MAKKTEERKKEIQTQFNYIPYLNSSLFEITELENKTLVIGSLNYEYKLPFFKATVLKNSQGKKKVGELNTLDYLFEFLSAYDFTSEGAEEIQEENKTLINASVLGLIFEKINGYKDGSFFTPGFITMYMCRETIKRAVIQKFNQVKQWSCENLTALYNKIDDINEANHIINSIKICDPAVGSGHFLVSALNEIIAIKSELKILQDRAGKRLKEYSITVANDDLVIVDEDGKLFNYNPQNAESQRIQETLFYEKKTIIENCLFGVDININSVKICRLRLWIELLKNAYYKNDIIENNQQEYINTFSPQHHNWQLETLPNIDINIKCGNSLISRFDLSADLKSALKKHKLTIEDYQQAVKIYQNPKNRQQKQEMEKVITQIKDNFTTVMTGNDPIQQELRKKENLLYNLQNQTSLFAETAKEKKAREKKERDLQKQINKLKKEIEDKKNNLIYQNGFEWRFEFPEVLNNQGDFVGFDVILGNPPYIRQEEFSALKPLLKTKYSIYNSIADLLTYFVELAHNILKDNGVFQFIISNKFTRANYGKQMRSFLLTNTCLTHFIDFSGLPVFDEATVDACILGFVKNIAENQDNSSSLLYADISSHHLIKDNFIIVI